MSNSANTPLLFTPPATEAGVILSLGDGTSPTRYLTGRSFTLECWVNPAQLNYRHTIFCTDDEEGINQTLHFILQNGRPYMAFYGNDTAGQQQLQSNQWYHLAFRYDFEKREQAIFVNGKLDILRQDSQPFAGSGNLVIGHSKIWQQFYGQIKQVRLWSTPLTNAQIRTSMLEEDIDDPELVQTWFAAPLKVNKEIFLRENRLKLGDREIELKPSIEADGTVKAKISGDAISSIDIANAFLNIQLPEELPDITLDELSISINNLTGAFKVEAKRTISTLWDLPLAGKILPADKVSFVIEREKKQDNGDPGILRASIDISLSVDKFLFEDVSFKGGSKLSFKLNPEIKDEKEEDDSSVFLIIKDFDKEEDKQPGKKKEKEEETKPTTTLKAIPIDTWVLAGCLFVEILGAKCTLSAELQENEKEKERTIKLTGLYESDDPLIKLENVAYLDARKLEITITRRAAKGASSANGASDKHITITDSNYEYDWSFTAAAGFGLNLDIEEQSLSIRVDGQLVLKQAKEKTSFVFESLKPQAGQTPPGLMLPIPFIDHKRPLYLNLNIDQVSLARKKEKWTFQIAAGGELFDLIYDHKSEITNRKVIDRGLPQNVQDALKFVDNQLARVIATITITDETFTLEINRLLNPLVIDIPSLSLPDPVDETARITYDIEPMALDLSRLRLVVEKKKVTATVDLGIGLPAGVKVSDTNNEAVIKAFDIYNNVVRNVIRVYLPDEEDHDSFIRFRLGLRATSKNAADIAVSLVQSPFSFIEFEKDESSDAHYITIDSQKFEIEGDDPSRYDFGAIRFKVPTFSFNGQQLTASGKFEVQRQLQIPLQPIRELLKAVFVTANLADENLANILLPIDAIPLMSIEIFRSDGSLNKEGLDTWLDEIFAYTVQKTGANPQLKQKVQQLIHTLPLEQAVDLLPLELREYFNYRLPTEFEFDISISVDGGCKLDIGVGDESPPIRLLTISEMGFIGIQLRKLGVGQILAGSLLVAQVDMTLDIFDWQSLLSSGAAHIILPGDYNLLAKPADLHNQLVIKNLLLFIVYQAGVPIPIPIFFDELGYRVHNLTDTRAGVSVGFPMPGLNLIEIVYIAIDLKKFIFQSDYLLPEGGSGQLIQVVQVGERATDLQLTFGSNFLQLPPYITNKEGEPLKLGLELKGRLSISARRNIAIALNALKKLSINQLIQAVPLNVRVNKQEFSLFSVFQLDMTWLLTTPLEFRQISRPSGLPVQGYLDMPDMGPEDQVSLSVVWQDWDGIRNAFATLFDDNQQLLQDALTIANADSAHTDQDEQGIFFFARGQMTLVKQFLELDGMVGFSATRYGSLTFFNGKGAVLNNLFRAELMGQTKLTYTGRKPHFALRGKFSLSFLGEDVFFSSLSLDNRGFLFAGTFNLFPQNNLIEARGELKGYARANEFYLHGNGSISFINGAFKFANGKIRIIANPKTADFMITGNLLGAQVDLAVQSINNSIRIIGRINPFELPTVVQGAPPIRFSGKNGGSPSLVVTFDPANGTASLKISGRIEFMGIFYEGSLDFNQNKWQIVGSHSDGYSTMRIEAGGNSGPNWLNSIHVRADTYLFRVLHLEDRPGTDFEIEEFYNNARYAADRSAAILSPDFHNRFSLEKRSPVGKTHHNNPVKNPELFEQGPITILDGFTNVVMVVLRSWRTNRVYAYGYNTQNGHHTGWLDLEGWSYNNPTASWFAKNEYRVFIRGTVLPDSSNVNARLYSKAIVWDGNQNHPPSIRPADSWEQVGNHIVAPNTGPYTVRRFDKPELVQVHKGTTNDVAVNWWWEDRDIAKPHAQDFWPFAYNTSKTPIPVFLRDGTHFLLQVSSTYRLYRVWAHGSDHIMKSYHIVSPPNYAFYNNSNDIAVVARTQLGYATVSYTSTSNLYNTVLLEGFGQITGRPAIAHHNGQFHVFARDAKTGFLRHCYTTNFKDNPDWFEVKPGYNESVFNFPIMGSPAVFSNQMNNTMVVFAQSAHGSLVMAHWQGNLKWIIKDLGVPDMNFIQGASFTSQDKLSPGGILKAGSGMLISSNKLFSLYMETSGNLVLQRNNNQAIIWSSNTFGRGNWAVMQDDGNFVIYSATGHAVWNTATHNHHGAALFLQNNGSLAIYKPDGEAIWRINP